MVEVLEEFPVHASLAASDLARARAWYEEKLGLIPKREDPGGLWYECAGPTWFGVYVSGEAGTARNTVAGWTVKGIESVMEELRGRGVEFEEYDLGEIKTVEGLAVMGPYKAAWVKDSEGNILEISEVPD